MNRPQDSSQARALREQRRAQVADLLLSGCNQEDCARILGVSFATISRDCQALRDKWQAEAGRSMESLVAQENERLNRLLNAVWAASMVGDKDAVANALKIATRRSKLLGLDAAMKTDVTLKTAEEQELGSKLNWMAENLAEGRAMIAEGRATAEGDPAGIEEEEADAEG